MDGSRVKMTELNIGERICRRIGVSYQMIDTGVRCKL